MKSCVASGSLGAAAPDDAGLDRGQRLGRGPGLDPVAFQRPGPVDEIGQDGDAGSGADEAAHGLDRSGAEGDGRPEAVLRQKPRVVCSISSTESITCGSSASSASGTRLMPRGDGPAAARRDRCVSPRIAICSAWSTGRSGMIMTATSSSPLIRRCSR